MAEEALRAARLPAAVVVDALLVVSELVSNAIRHARTDFVVAAEIRGSTLRLEVRDYDTRPPALLGLDEESTSGRGLHMVSAIAAEWGWNTEEGGGESGKVVWAEIELDAPELHAQG
jgi:anti-sigma regulatory factor (Ser/Thr protein kinase)